MKNQDILRKLTAQELATKNVNTSFLMMPLRLETMFMDNHPVEEIYEPERILYTLKQAWELLCFMRKCYTPEAIKETVRLIGKLHVEVEKLDVLYKHDKYLLTDILTKMENLLPKKADIHDDWAVLKGKVERLQTIDAMKYNRASDLLNRLEHYTRRLENTCSNPPYYGKERIAYGAEYSQTAIYKAGAKHFRECRKFIEAFPTELNKVPWMTETQVEKLRTLLEKWSEKGVFRYSLSYRYELFSTTEEETEKKDGENKIEEKITLKSVAEAKRNFLGEWNKLKDKKLLGNKVEEIIAGVSCQRKAPYRYTKAVNLIFDRVVFARRNNRNWVNEGNSNKNWQVNEEKLNELRQILANTVFDYREQQMFTLTLMRWFNANLSDCLDCSVVNRYDRYIYKKLMMYRKQKKCLCVRIYPDELAVTQNIRPLSKNEYLSGRDFWLKYIFATDDSERKALWLGICDLWPAYRAAWIVRKTFPSSAYKVLVKRAKDFHIEEKSFEEYADEINGNFLNAFPMTYVEDGQQVFDVPATELLPERFVLQAVLKTNNKNTTTICKYGHRLPQSLQLGLDLNNMENAVEENQSQGHVLLNGSLRWMTDYNEAERMGMAITLPLDQFAYERLSVSKEFRENRIKYGYNNNDPEFHWDGKNSVVRKQKNKQHRDRTFFFDAVYVVGINKESESECEKILSDLLDAHLYSDNGYSLLNIGTATNILTDEDQKANTDQFDTSDEALVERFKHQPENCIKPVALAPEEDLGLLKRLFALNNSVLGNIKDKNNSVEHHEILKAQIANKTLIEILDNKVVEIFRNNPELKDFLSNDVLARGPFPPIRIGSQPYGILPICDFRNLKYNEKSPFYVLHQILLYLTDKWNDIADHEVSYCNEFNGLTADTYLKIAGSTPISSYFQKVQSVKEKDSPFLLVADFFNFTDTNGHTEKEQSETLKEIRKILAHRYGALMHFFPLSPYLNGSDEIRIIEKDSENDYHQNFSNLQIPNLVAAVKAKVGYLLTETEEAKRDEEVKRLIIEFFDLFAYRLDAWMMGLLSNKLRRRMKTRRHRIAIGTYGWVFNLKQSTRENEVQKEPGEFLLAPSVNQAITGAVLRSAYKNSRLNNNTDYTYSVNLSSERVRNAIRIIEGVRNGLAIGTILGTDLERLLHDAYKNEELKKELKKKLQINSDFQLELDEAIYPLRKLYPMVEQMEHDDETASNEEEEIKDNDITVINGAKLLEDYRNNGRNIQFVRSLNAFRDSTKIIVDGTDVSIEVKNQALLKLLDRIDDEYDALTDIILSEGVYKLTQGQREAVDALMQALDTGKNIPMPQVAEIPITSAQVDGSLVVALDPEATTDSKSLLACVELKVDQWIGETIGVHEEWKELGLSASEMVYLSANSSSFLRYLELKNWLRMEEGVYNPEPRYKEHFETVELMLDNMRELLASARILRSDDLVKETGVPDESLYETLQDKYDMAFERVQMLTENLADVLARQSQLQNPANANYETTALPDEDMREALQLAAYCFSIGQTTAMDAVEEELFVGTSTLYNDSDAFLMTVRLQHTFFEKLKAIHENLCIIINDAKKIVDEATERSYRTYIEAIRKLLVSDMLLVPVIKPDTNVVPIEELYRQYKQNNSTCFKNVTSLTVDDNIQSLSKVSPQMMRFHQLRLFQKWNAFDGDDAVQPAPIVPMQIPIIGDKAVWLGTEVESEEYVGDAFTYMVEQPANFPYFNKEGQPLLAGIVIDHWIERIPYKDQTAGLAFNYDQPDAEAPQALLLAVSTKDGNKSYWSEDMLLRTVKSTMNLVKCRSVEPDDLKKRAWTAGLFPLMDYKDNQ